jgi:hypothetical protein
MADRCPFTVYFGEMRSSRIGSWIVWQPGLIGPLVQDGVRLVHTGLAMTQSLS